MKKLFLTVMALAGMITGLTLTSCGGGGGGNNLTGTLIRAAGQAVAYNLHITEQIAPDAYFATISDMAGSEISELTIVATDVRFAGDGSKTNNLDYLVGTVSANSLKVSDNSAFYNILAGTNSKNEHVTKLYFPNPISFIYDSSSKFIHWTGEVTYTAVHDTGSVEDTTVIDAKDPIISITKQ